MANCKEKSHLGRCLRRSSPSLICSVWLGHHLRMPRVEVNKIELEYKVQGSGDPVLLVCGTSQQAVTWDIYTVPALVKAGYQVITFDNRGSHLRTARRLRTR